MQLAKLEAKIRQESSQNGRSLPEDQLASYLMGQFEEAMKAIEAQVYAKYQTTEDEVKVATEFYEEEEDKDVANAVAKLQELYRVMTGGGFSDVEVPADLTLNKVRPWLPGAVAVREYCGGADYLCAVNVRSSLILCRRPWSR